MNDNIHLENPILRLTETIHQFSDQYGLAYIKCAIVKENEPYLYLADIKIQHKEDIPMEETIHEYENIILATIPLTLNELEKVIEELDSGKINLKSLGSINAKNSFDSSYYHISSRTHYAGFYYDWPCYCFRASLDERKNLQNVYGSLTKPGLPAYPNFYEACNAFFQHEHSPNQNSPVSINFLIPNYDARIKILEIADKQISALVERKDPPLDNLVAQIFCKKADDKTQNSKDIKFNDTGTAKFTASFVPDNVFVYILNSKNGETVDSKAFGSHYTDRTDGIIVKTSVENLETMLAKGESQQIEFKYDLDKEKTEFLESIVAFANTNDGAILLGVDNDGKVVGFFDDFDKIDKKIRGLVSGHCEPDIEISVEQIILEGKPIIVVKVKEGKNKPYLLSGKSAYKRVDKDDHVFKRLDFDEILNKKQTSYDRIRI